jgi:hypothetical protein
MADQQTLNASPVHACRSSAVSAEAVQLDATSVSAAAIGQSDFNVASPHPSDHHRCPLAPLYDPEATVDKFVKKEVPIRSTPITGPEVAPLWLSIVRVYSVPQHGMVSPIKT